MADFLYGDGAPPWTGAGLPVRPGSTLGVVSVWLSLSLSVPGRHLKKGGSPPPPPPSLLIPTLGWPSRGGLVSAPQLPTPGWPLEERRETPPRYFLFFFVSFFFFGGGGGGVGVEAEGLGVGYFRGERYLGRGLCRVGCVGRLEWDGKRG